MRRFAGIFAMTAILSMLAACGSDGSNNGVEDDLGINIKQDTIGQDIMVNPDKGTYDPGPPPMDDGKKDNYTPYDTGPQTDKGGTDTNGTDTNGTDIPGVDNYTPPVGTCKWYFACAGDCPPQPQGTACLQECQSALSPAGEADVTAFYNCLDVNGCQAKATDEEFYQCLEDFCMDPYFTCFSGNMYATCPDLIGCLNTCPDDNPGTPDVNEQSVCIGNCWSESTVDAQWSLQNLIDCMYDNCTTCNDDYEGATCQDCLNTVLGTGGLCETLNDACMAYGTWGCGHVFDCVMACQDQPCVQDCFNNSTKNAGTLYNDMIGCASDACPSCDTTPPGDDCNTCFNAALNENGACWDKVQLCSADQDVQ